MALQTLREALRAGALTLFLAVAAGAAAAQRHHVPNYMFTPAAPKPGEEATVFIRTTDPVNGYVLCPEAAAVITRVEVERTSVVLDLQAFGPAGGFQMPYCDGNTVSLGVLGAGIYRVTARFVLPNGTVGPTALTGWLAVGPMQVPTLSPAMLWICAGLMVLTGTWLTRGRR
jgi:hypothetical protein